ncbi:RAD5-like protein [Coniella lustricola]|uniref:RAD5-like protein n=1 Tax=Coniella lustricola TaxID=2025994 RepID=A0A2T2ZWL2_9PEZI|nr:RAD5-like protein [Coniella lustricola]
MPPYKRRREVIDLTGDDAVAAPKAKNSRSRAPASRHIASSSNPRLAQSSQAAVIDSAAARGSFYDDETDPIGATQSDDGPAYQLYGKLDNKIVGCRYYTGLVTAGEIVVLRREPRNQYDKNAVRVDNVLGTQVGHLPAKLVDKLAAHVDSGDLRIEGTITGEKGYFDCPVQLALYGPADPIARFHLEEKLKSDKLFKATQLKQARPKPEDLPRPPLGLNSSQSLVGLGNNGPEVSLADLAQTSQAVRFRSSSDNLKALVIDETTLSGMPMAYQPSALKSQLLPHQLQGLAWLQAKENPEFPQHGSDNVTQLWKRAPNGRYRNVATNFTGTAAPGLAKGGILADDMGLGKTIQMLSLILSNGPGQTLIVAPKSVMSNWAQQALQHVKESNALRVHIYHGNDKLKAAELKAYDIVITSYQTMVSDKMAEGSLFSTSWKRIILDEGHVIRNAQTQTALAACEVKAEARWVLTGTPIVNNIKDLHSMVKFLGLTGGIEEAGIFHIVITRPLMQGLSQAEILIQYLMRDICLRRTKDMQFVDLKLPKKTEYVHRITFHAEEKQKYDALLAEAKGALHEVRARARDGKKSSGSMQNVLERLLRLRQVCNHWTLCKQRVVDLLQDLEDQDVVDLNAENREILQQALSLYIENREECPVCLDTLNAPVITHCKHVFCFGCIRKVIQTQNRCPMCRHTLSEEQLLEPAPETSGAEDVQLDLETQSSKTEAMFKILQATLRVKGSKVIIFSQWTKFLTIIENQLMVAGHGYTRIDGSMSPQARDGAMTALKENPECRIMLASLAVCSVGLNLVAADTVILTDSWWAPAIEDQAVDRVHRLGQTRPTTVWRLVMEGTVEERVLDIQAEKRELVDKAFQEKSKGKRTKETRMADIMKLLG